VGHLWALRVGHLCSIFGPPKQIYDARCELFLIDSTRVTLRLLERLPTEPCHELVCARAGFGKSRSGSLAQPMGGAVLQARLVAPIAKLVAKSSRGERAPPVVTRCVAPKTLGNHVQYGRWSARGGKVLRASARDSYAREGAPMDRKAEIINVSRDCWLLVQQLIALLP